VGSSCLDLFAAIEVDVRRLPASAALKSLKTGPLGQPCNSPATTLVEAPGIEPGSESASRETSTCVARKLISPAGRLRTGSKQASLRKSPQER